MLTDMSQSFEALYEQLQGNYAHWVQAWPYLVLRTGSSLPWAWTFIAQRAVCMYVCMYVGDAVFAVAGGWRVEVDCRAACQVLAVCSDGMDGWDGVDGWIGWDLRTRGVGRCDWLDVIFR